FWAATEWARLAVTGQLWNALGYSQAFHPTLIRPAVWGGVYAVGFVIVVINTAGVLLLTVRRKQVGIAIAALVLLALSLVSFWSLFVTFADASVKPPVTV